LVDITIDGYLITTVVIVSLYCGFVSVKIDKTLYSHNLFT